MIWSGTTSLMSSEGDSVMSRNSPLAPVLSIVVPIFNEAGTLDELHRRLTSVLFLLGLPSEIIYVDDGSSDGTSDVLAVLAARYSYVRTIPLARNYGQTAALTAGFDAAVGDVIIAMDGDLQHAPEEIPKLLAKLDEGYDIVSGWREQRVDNLWTRRLPSRIANWLIAKLSGVSLHDFGTTFKAYRAPVIKRIRLYGELHRFIPALASWGGARIAEVPIANIPRPQNHSHYGLSRTWRVAADLITVRFLLRYVTRPLHLFGLVGFASVTAGLVGGGWIAATKIVTGAPVFLAHGPLLLLSALLIQTGVVLIGLGLLAELLTRIYMDGRRRRIYTIARRRLSRKEWGGPRPVPVPQRSGALQ
ncbi:MAG TPA: glycosyltransferase family 2 protein [Vicinamibacterales bacterium]|nr:glycosyltransferase family 2 protein [Vicinamibacterales bacterium]